LASKATNALGKEQSPNILTAKSYFFGAKKTLSRKTTQQNKKTKKP